VVLDKLVIEFVKEVEQILKFNLDNIYRDLDYHNLKIKETEELYKKYNG
jgi:hypothetical protein